jgi:hypothetical protein
VTLGHKLVQGPRRDPLLPAVHSLLSPTPRIRLSVFSDTYALFHFWDHSYPAPFPQVAYSFAKNRGYTPTGSFLFTLAYPELGRRAHPPQLQRRRAISFISPASEHQPRMFFVSPTYAKMGECTPTQKCRRADIFDFSPDFRAFSIPSCSAHSPSTAGTERAGLKVTATLRKGRATGRCSGATGHFLCYPICRRPSRP